MANRNYFVHDAAIVESERIGEKTRIWAFVHILPGAQIGRNCNICDHCFIENDVIIGDNVTIKSGVYLWDGIRIEDNVFVGPNVVFTNDMFPRSKKYPPRFLETHLREGASIGANVTIIPGVEIGRYAFIGAGSVVTRNVPDYGFYYGNPARPHGYVCECAARLNFTEDLARCESCGLEYRLHRTEGIVRRIS